MGIDNYALCDQMSKVKTSGPEGGDAPLDPIELFSVKIENCPGDEVLKLYYARLRRLEDWSGKKLQEVEQERLDEKANARKKRRKDKEAAEKAAKEEKEVAEKGAKTDEEEKEVEKKEADKVEA